MRAKIFIFLLLILLLMEVSFSMDEVKSITLVTRVFPEGEKVFAVVLEYAYEVDGNTLNPNIFEVESKIGNVGKRTVKRVYANSDGRLVMNFFANRGRYVIIELDPKDMNAITTYFDNSRFLTGRYKLEYLVTQKNDIYSIDGKKIPAFSLKNTDEKHLIIDDFIAELYHDKELNVDLPYRLFIPKNTDPSKRYPLVVFLHGAGERGNDNYLPLAGNRGAIVWAEPGHQAEHPCFVLAPQCPPYSSWTGLITSGNPFKANKELLSVANLIKDLISKYNIDKNRVYITGLSMGGYGTFAILMEHPELFASAIPICGGGDLNRVDRIKDIPIWVFHAEDDPMVPVSLSRDIVRKLVDIGGKVRYTEFPKDYLESIGYHPHASWVPAYESEEVVDWLFSNSK